MSPARDELARIMFDFHPAGFRLMATALAHADTRDLLPKIQTGTLISYSLRGDARPGSTLRPACVQTDPDYPESSHKIVG